MEKELKIKGIFYMPMSEEETESQAIDRFEKKCEEAGIIINNSCCEYETQEI